jgi:ATP-dependent DNA helicase Q1
VDECKPLVAGCLLYVTPEKVAGSKRLMAKLEKAHAAGRLARVILDEVRPCKLKHAEIRV